MDWSSILDITFRNVLSTDTVYFIIAAIGLNVQFGYAGLLNFGQAAFLACGAYGMGMTAHYFQVSTLVVAPEFKDVGALGVLILILLIRPQGILGRRERVG